MDKEQNNYARPAVAEFCINAENCILTASATSPSIGEDNDLEFVI